MAHTGSLSTRKLEGKVAIVTGGASGIGEVTTHLFADHGAIVVIADLQDGKGQTVAKSIGLDRCSYMHCDVSNEEQVKAMVDWTIQKYGQLDIMFSNAGIVSNSEQSLLDLNFSYFDHLFRVNVRGMAICVKHAELVMVEKRVKGTIVCTVSALANNCNGCSNLTDYIMSKNAVLGLVRAASQQLGLHGIRVNSVSPSMVLTPLTASVGMKSDEIIQEAFGPVTSLKGVILKAKHVEESVLFLTSQDSAFITGHDLVVDGGLVSIRRIIIAQR